MWLGCAGEAIAAYLALSKVDLGAKLEKGKKCMHACIHAWVDLGSKVESGGKLSPG